MSLFFLFLTLGAADQDIKPGKISGQVVDAASGQSLAGVNVMLQDTELGGATDQYGRYRIENVAPGEYSLEISMIGYQARIITRVEALPNRAVFVDVKLKKEAISMGEVTVKPSYFEADPASTSSNTRLNYHEMRNHPEGYNVARTIASLPGVATGFDFSSDIVVRGGDPDENLTIIDNVPVPYPVHFPSIGGGFGQASIVSVETLDGVEFSPGGYPARFGGKLSSMMNIDLRDGNKNRFEALFDLNMSAIEAVIEGPVGKKVNYIASYRKSFLEIVDFVSDIGDVVPSFDDGFLRIAYFPSINHKIWAFAIQTYDRMNVPGGRNGASSDMTWRGYQTIGGINWRMMLGEIGFSTLTFGASSVKNNLTSVDSVSDNTVFFFRPSELHLYAQEAININPWHGHQIQFGAFVGYSSIDHKYFAVEDTTADGSVIAEQTDTTEGDWYKMGSYAQYIFTPLNWFRFTPGVRIDYNTLTSELAIEPRGGVAINLFANTILNLSFGIYNQFNNFPTHVRYDGLASKRAIHGIVGVEQMVSNDVKLSIEYYYKYLDNLLHYDEVNEIYTNQGSGKTDGVEVFIQKKMGQYFHGQASYSLSFGERENPADGTYDADWDIRHMVTLIGGVKFLKHFEASAKFSYASPKPWTPFDLDNAWYNSGTEDWVVYRVEDRNSGRLPAYSRLDLQLSHTSYTRNGIAISGFINLQNVLFHDNVLDYSWTVEDGAVVLDPWEQFGFMPVGGVTVKF